MIDAKRATLIFDNGEIKVKEVKSIKIINWHERNKQLVSWELMCRNSKAVKIKEDGRPVKQI